MNSFSINFLIVLFVAALGTLGWFGLQQLERGTDYVVLEQGEQLPEPEPEVVIVEEPVAETPSAEVPALTPEVAKLISDLESLIKDVVIMKEGSSGTRVGVVQRFLNEYHGRTDSVDNSYGPGTAARVRDFQKENSLTADGQTGPNTYKKMIESLKKANQ